MEKLIELLNEYDEGGNWRKLHWIGLGCEDHNTIGYKDKELTCEQDEVVAYLISKKFGFIKWLVDNDKIDRDRCECRQLYNALKRSEDAHGDKNFSKCERIIMLLAIQDEPIEFLLSILK